MQTISEDSPARLVFRVRSPLQNAVGRLGLFFLLWLIVHWLTRHPNHERTIGLIGASITCLLATLIDTVSFFPRQLLPSAQPCATTSLNVTYVRPAILGDVLTARAELGKRLFRRRH